MRKPNPELLVEFRKKTWCEHCKKRGRIEVHHIMPRGMGDAFRLDIRENLISLCRECHDRAHVSGSIFRDILLDLVAKRQGYTDGKVLWVVLTRLRNDNSETCTWDSKPSIDDQRHEVLPPALQNETGESLEAPEGDGTVNFS